LRSYAKSGVLDEVRAAGGEIIAVTSEPHSLALEAEQAWEIGYPAVGDPHHEIRTLCAERGWVDVFYNEDCGHLRERAWASHPNGYYQPAVLAVTREGRVLYRWRCVPKYSNMSGAGARPEARYTWDKIHAALESEGDAGPDIAPKMGADDLSWPRFLLILLAHGWFLRPRAFPLARDTDPRRVSPGKMMSRVYLFAAAWVLAAILLPPLWVGIAALAWVVAMVPGLVEIHRQFQNEPEPY